MPVPELSIAVASTNPVKLAAARMGFLRAFPTQSITIQAFSPKIDTPAQPIGDMETYQGAMQRVGMLRTRFPDAAFWVGIEGGVEKRLHGGYDSFAWIIVEDTGQQSSSRTSTFPLPPAVCRYLDQGMELGDADDRVFGRSQSKQQQGAVGLLTKNQITRTDLLAQSVFLALIPFQSPDLFKEEIIPIER
jgi:inosine/xanthosine triphosphatase